MTNEIIELFVNYNENSRLIDNDFYAAMFDVLKKTPGISNYVNELILINEDNRDDPRYSRYTEGLTGLMGRACYDTISNNFVVYSDNIRRMVRKQLSDFSLNESDSVTMYNLLVLQTVLHEMEHIEQKRLMSEGDNFESELLRATHSDEPDNSYTYQYNLHERLAEIRSYSQILSMYEYMGISNQIIYDYFNDKLKSTYLNGYHFLDENGYIASQDSGGIFTSSTDTYVLETNCDKEKYRNLASLVEDENVRYMYGLSIPLEKYQEYSNENDFHL